MMRHALGSNASIGGVLGSGRAAAAGNGLLTGLVAYWGLDEASGNALDKHSGGLTLTQTNSPGASTGIVYGTARTFNGTQYFRRNSEAALQTGNIDFALAAWVYVADTANRSIAGKFNYSTNNREFALIHESTLAQFVVSADGSGTLSRAQLSLPTQNAWHFYVAWHDATANKIYLQIDNGTPAETAHSTGVFVGASPFDIGYLFGVYSWSGRIGPVTFWKNRTLSADDRTALWNGGAGLAYSAFTS